jgi:hypothetical protein
VKIPSEGEGGGISQIAVIIPFMGARIAVLMERPVYGHFGSGSREKTLR